LRGCDKSMAYRVRISPTALGDAEAVFIWLKENISGTYATAWYNGLVDSIYSLEDFPGRCPLTPESEDLGINLRQLLYGKRSMFYRILFAIELDEATGTEFVKIFHIRHGARDRIKLEDLE
jgi:plasmid stabilization system protein ParE